MNNVTATTRATATTTGRDFKAPICDSKHFRARPAGLARQRGMVYKTDENNEMHGVPRGTVITGDHWRKTKYELPTRNVAHGWYAENDDQDRYISLPVARKGRGPSDAKHFKKQV